MSKEQTFAIYVCHQCSLQRHCLYFLKGGRRSKCFERSDPRLEAWRTSKAPQTHY